MDEQRPTVSPVIVFAAKKRAQLGIPEPGVMIRRVGLKEFLPGRAGLFQPPLTDQGGSQPHLCQPIRWRQCDGLSKLADRLIETAPFHQQVTEISVGNGPIRVERHSPVELFDRLIPATLIIQGHAEVQVSRSLGGRELNRHSVLCDGFAPLTFLLQGTGELRMVDSPWAVKQERNFQMHDCIVGLAFRAQGRTEGGVGPTVRGVEANALFEGGNGFIEPACLP